VTKKKKYDSTDKDDDDEDDRKQKDFAKQKSSFESPFPWGKN